MRKIRVLVVDDSVVIRKLVTDALSADPDIEIVGTAGNGRVGLTKIAQLNPDLVTLDIEMPEMDGLEALAALRKTHPKLPVIMFSTLTQRGAAATLDALALGASDYVAKPANVGSVTVGIQRVQEDLIPKIKAFCRRAPSVTSLPAPPRLLNAGIAKRQHPTPNTQHPTPRSPHAAIGGAAQRIDVVAIGVSTGGPNALASLFPQWLASFPVPIVLVQHMPPTFTRLLAERLAAQSALRINEGKSGEILAPGQAWIAPGDFHMTVERDAVSVRLGMNQGPPENSCRPAVDVLFRSVARVFGPHVLGVVLTGMGQDGLHGCEAIKAAGGHVFIQDEASSVVWGMPGTVAKAGLADKILPLEQLGAEILRRVEEGRIAPATTGASSAQYGEWRVNRAAQQR
jgi:two-component system chemotaxis response regulator CheB